MNLKQADLASSQLSNKMLRTVALRIQRRWIDGTHVQKSNNLMPSGLYSYWIKYYLKWWISADNRKKWISGKRVITFVGHHLEILMGVSHSAHSSPVWHLKLEDRRTAKVHAQARTFQPPACIGNLCAEFTPEIRMPQAPTAQALSICSSKYK